MSHPPHLPGQSARQPGTQATWPPRRVAPAGRRADCQRNDRPRRVPASAASVCAPGADICVVITDAVQTPLGPVTVAVSAANVVTVQLTPTAPNTLVIGIPFAIPPGPPTLPGYTRTSITTAGGVVNIDTFLPRQGRQGVARPNLAIVSIHPPGPCRVRTSGTTVVFTPIIPPGPPRA